MKKFGLVSSVFAFALVVLTSLTACFSTTSQNDRAYWFSSYSERMVEYTENPDNRDEAGKYREMTVKKDCTITIAIRGGLSMYSGTYFTVNGKQKQSERGDGIFTYQYNNLALKKGDKLVFHTFCTNPLMINDTDFDFSMFNIINDEGNFPINDIK